MKIYIIALLVFGTIGVSANLSARELTINEAQIKDCFQANSLVNAIPLIKQCFENLKFLGEWSGENTVVDQTIKSLQNAKSADDLYLPVFYLAYRAGDLSFRQKVMVSQAMRHTLDKLTGYRGEFTGSESSVNEARDFVIDAAVAMAVAGVAPNDLIPYLNDKADQSKSVRKRYVASVYRRVQFFVNYAGIQQLRRYSDEQKSGYFAGYIFDIENPDVQGTLPGYAKFGGLSFLRRAKWRSKASQIVIKQPLFEVLKSLLPLMDNQSFDIEKAGYIEQPVYRLRELGQWAHTILTELGFKIDKFNGGDRKRKKQKSSLCELQLLPLVSVPALVPVPVGAR